MGDTYLGGINVSQLANKAIQQQTPKSTNYTPGQVSAMMGPSPMDAIKKRMDAIQAPTPVATENDAYKAKDYSTAALPQYDAQRSQLAQQYNQQRSGEMDAMDRRFAAMGNNNSGAHEVAAQELETKMAQGRDQANLGINQQEDQARQALNLQEQQKSYQSEEAQKGRNLQIAQYNNQSQQAYGQNQFENSSKIQAIDMAMQQFQEDQRNSEFNKQIELHKEYG